MRAWYGVVWHGMGMGMGVHVDNGGGDIRSSSGRNSIRSGSCVDVRFTSWQYERVWLVV